MPLLLPCKDSSAQGILGLLGEHCPAKEVAIAVQEAVEHLEALHDESRGEENDENDNIRSTPAQLITLIQLYASCMSSSFLKSF